MSGIHTQQYKTVQENFGVIIGALQTTPGSKAALEGAFVAKGWIGPGTSPTENQLVTLALGRIQADASQFDIFYNMLNGIPGMGLTLQNLDSPASAHRTVTSTPQTVQTASGPTPLALAEQGHGPGMKPDSHATQPPSLSQASPAPAPPQLRGDGGGSDADKFIVYKRKAHKKGDGETPHGLALIISNDKFDSSTQLDDRICSPWDDKRLATTLLALGYRVVLKKNQTAAEIKGHLETIQLNEPGELCIKQDDDSFIFCISSHGKWDEKEKADFIYGKDGGKVYLQRLAYEKLNCRASPSLYAKPKLFFVQACRGVEKGQAGSLRADGDEDSAPLPLESDFLFSYATAPETKAFRYDPNGPLADGQSVDITQVVDKKDGFKYGSLYITELCEAIDRYGFTLDLMNIVLSVHQTLQTERKYFFDGQFRMCPHLTTSLRGPVFFYDRAEELFKKYMEKSIEEAKK